MAAGAHWARKAEGIFQGLIREANGGDKLNAHGWTSVVADADLRQAQANLEVT